jgi:cardiolipin synthase A/B
MPHDLSTSSWLPTMSGWAYALLVLACVVTALFRKRDTSAALGWSLAIVFLPGIGPVLFLAFGCTKISRRLARKIEHGSVFAADNSVGGTLLEHGRPAAGRAAPDTAWGTLSRVMELLNAGPPRAGNSTRLYSSASVAYEEMERAIREAKHHVHVEFYIFRDDEVGQRLVDALCERARAGVEVRLILDGVGSLGGYRLKRRLQRSGARVVSFLPLFHFAKLASPNLRNHRKLVICDGRIAFFGGLNVGREYLGRHRDKGRDWADLHMGIEGPATWDLSWTFIEDWDYCAGELLEGSEYFPPAESAGDQLAQVVGGGPDRRPNPIRQAFLGAIVRARTSIVIATPYLVPDSALCDALAMASRSGVDVRILTQSAPPEKWIPFLCSWTFVEDMEPAGVQVFGYTPGMMHAKAMVVDGEWAMLGTANLDNRSMFLNFELMVLLDGGPGPSCIESELQNLIRDSMRLDMEWIATRPIYQRFLARAARLLAPVL